MALYLGGNKVKIFDASGNLFNLNIYSQNIITNGIKLITSDNYIITDSQGVYITVLEDNTVSP